MKTSSFPHVIATKRLSCKNRKFQLSDGTLIFLKNASLPMIEWLQEVNLNDSEALMGDTDTLMKIDSSVTRKKSVQVEILPKQRKKKQLYFRLRPPFNE